MNVTFNKNQIIELYAVNSKIFTECPECCYRKIHSKGEKIWYFWRKKYYDQDYYGMWFGSDIYTEQEMNEIIKKEYDFDEYHLFEFGGTICRYPFVKIVLPNDITHRIFFKTYLECEQYINDLKDSNNFLMTINVE